MKDAKGHGSNPRGTHAAGTDQVGQPNNLLIRSAGGWQTLSRDGVQRVNARQTYRVLPSEIPGLSYVRTDNGKNRSYSLYHEATGRIIGDWGSRHLGPSWDGHKLDTGQIDASLRPLSVDWKTHDVESHPNFNATRVRWALYGREK